jgi:Fanconi anemia group J protein
MTQTFQPVNQTIGRIIRNKSDYGVVILIDQRYEKNANFEHLSEWFTKTIRSSSSKIS